ncbi:DUF1566 domain-containing protein [Rhodoferax sp.]|uniref:Lcl C-terminal domain-containing protein n=1 Tax=Rhodoferax sp. TaxID=50421 RepID=UPI00261DC252|nr:DUF1566 domain-containing protein [Rhodoferax sp.]MDD2923635.1 DUF1566 domain-containing protein [Rhodoferax sp.]
MTLITKPFLRRSLGAMAAVALLLAGQAQAAAPFVDNNDGTVTDTSTGLMWDQCSLGQTQGGNTCTGSPTAFTWLGAQTQAATLQSGSSYKGYADWRLPNLHELQTLVKTGVSPSIDSAAFPATSSSWYWSATTWGPFPSLAWTVVFLNGSTDASGKASTNFVRLVRSGQSSGTFGLSRAELSGMSPSAATLTATSPVAATGYWMVVPRAAATPLATEIMAGVASYRGVTVAASGNAAMDVATPQTFAISGLSVGTHYDLYLVAKDTSYETVSDVLGPVEFASAAIATSSIVVNPVTPSTLFAGQDSGGVYKSTDSGATWAALNTGLSNLSVKALAIQPDASRLFVGTDGAGVFYGDGSSWTACGALSGGGLNVRSLKFAGSTLYAGTTAGVFASTDGCTSWVAMNTGLPN